jgi:hypothetical protein
LNSGQRCSSAIARTLTPEVCFRSHILLLLDDGHTWVTVAAMLFCSSRTIDRWVKRFHAEGLESVAGHRTGRPSRLDPDWVRVAVPEALTADRGCASGRRPPLWQNATP